MIRFGYSPAPDAGDYEATVRRVRLADRLGLDIVGIQDHPYQRRFVDTMSLIADLAARTEQIAFFPDVVCLPLRPPAMLAKAAATIDLTSGGRFELGLGAGAFWDAIEGYGGPTRTPPEALAALREAIAVIRAVWSGRRSLEESGEHYSIAKVHGGPVPAHDIGIWVGGAGPRMLRLIGEAADGWVPSMFRTPPDIVAGKHPVIDDAAEAAGREPRSIRRVYNIGGVIGDDMVDRDDAIVGGPDLWVDRLTELATTYRMDTLVLWPEGDADEQIERFATEVAPRVRERVG